MNKVDRGERVQAHLFEMPVQKKKKPKSNTELVLEHLKTKGPLSSWTAIQLYRITRLSAVVHQLRKHHVIESKDIRSKDGRKQYTSYKYVASLDELHNS